MGHGVAIGVTNNREVGHQGDVAGHDILQVYEPGVTVVLSRIGLVPTDIQHGKATQSAATDIGIIKDAALKQVPVVLQ